MPPALRRSVFRTTRSPRASSSASDMAGPLTTAGWLLLAFMLPGPAWAQDDNGDDRRNTVADRFGISGSVRTGFWTSTRDLDAERNVGVVMLWLKSERALSDRASFLFEGRSLLRGPLERGNSSTVVREAFINLKLGKLDVRAGRQIIAWGRADGLNPTDNLTGEDLTLMATEDDDRRLGATAVRASYYAGDVSLTGIWLPEFTPHRFPLPTAPGLVYNAQVDHWPGKTWAVRAEQTGRAVDWAVSYYQGPDLLPDIGVDPSAPASIQVTH